MRLTDLGDSRYHVRPFQTERSAKHGKRKAAP